jgi:hypothetical protein
MRLQSNDVDQDRATLLFERDSGDAFEDAFVRHGTGRAGPEKSLLLAVLGDALRCLRKYAHARDGRGQRLFREAEGWLLAEGEDWIFSFRSVCEALGLNHSYVRKSALGWKIKRSEIRPKRGDSRKGLDHGVIHRGKKPLRRSPVQTRL